MNDQLTNQDSCPTPRTAARPIPEGMTVLLLGQYGRPSLATAGLLVQWCVRPTIPISLEIEEPILVLILYHIRYTVDGLGAGLFL